MCLIYWFTLCLNIPLQWCLHLTGNPAFGRLFFLIFNGHFVLSVMFSLFHLVPLELRSYTNLIMIIMIIIITVVVVVVVFIVTYYNFQKKIEGSLL